jgi:hypothetical protein
MSEYRERPRPLGGVPCPAMRAHARVSCRLGVATQSLPPRAAQGALALACKGPLNGLSFLLFLTVFLSFFPRAGCAGLARTPSAPCRWARATRWPSAAMGGCTGGATRTCCPAPCSTPQPGAVRPRTVRYEVCRTRVSYTCAALGYATAYVARLVVRLHGSSAECRDDPQHPAWRPARPLHGSAPGEATPGPTSPH